MSAEELPGLAELMDEIDALGGEPETKQGCTVTLSYETDDGWPVRLQVVFPEDHALDALRAIVASGTTKAAMKFLAEAASRGDASVQAYIDSAGVSADDIDTMASALILASGEPSLDEADGFLAF